VGQLLAAASNPTVDAVVLKADLALNGGLLHPLVCTFLLCGYAVHTCAAIYVHEPAELQHLLLIWSLWFQISDFCILVAFGKPLN
jgi:hypothetical protein